MNKYTYEHPKKSEYYIQMKKGSNKWMWLITSSKNGKTIGEGRQYLNKAQCRNVGKRFACNCGIEWRE